VAIRRRRGATGLLASAAFSWGLAIVLTKVALEQLAPLDVFFLETSAGTTALWAFLLIRGRRPALSHWSTFAALGLLEPGLSFVAGDFGLAHTGAADAALLLASESLFAIALAWLVLSERPSNRAAMAVVVGFAGSVVIGLAPTADHATVLGDGLVLLGSVAAAAYSVAARRVAVDLDADPLSVTAVQLLAGAALSVPLLLGSAASGHSELGHADAWHLLIGAATGIASGAVPFLLYNAAIRDIEVAGAALVLNLVPVFAVMLAIVLIGEHPGVVQLVGGALVVVAALAAEAVSRPEPAAQV